MPYSTLPLCLVVLSIILTGVLCLLRRQIQTHRLPPGLSGIPFIGNALQITPKNAYKMFSKWGKKYGPVISIRIFSQTCIVINSVDAAISMLSKSSASTSFRIVRPMALLSGMGHSTPHLQPGGELRQNRQYTKMALGPAEMTQYEPEHERRAQRLIQKLLQNPPNLQHAVENWVALGFEHVAYGTDDEQEQSGFIELGHRALKIFTTTGDPMVLWPIDILPALRHLPPWLPGMSFKRKAVAWSRVVRDMLDRPVEKAVEKLKCGQTSYSLISRVAEVEPLETLDHNRLEILKNAAMNIYMAGFDTTASIVLSFYLAMVLHPEVQKRGQQEIDAVTHGLRLPRFEDRPNLPYVDWIMKETMRWAIPTPFVFPHVQDPSCDGLVDGMFIPRGSLLIVNTGGIFEDPEVYSDPLRFWPERFQDDTILDPFSVAFGYARRQCIGVHFIEKRLWITIAMTLATMDICPPTDPNANLPRAAWTDGPMRLPLPFDASFKVRNAALLEI